MSKAKPSAEHHTPYVAILVWNTVFILIALVLIELVYGSWFASNQLENLNILRNRIWHYEVDYPGIPTDERSIVYSRDEWGLRGDYGHPRNIDLLTVGGSTTDQRYISEGFTWQDRLQEKFQTNGVDFRVANAGVDGRTTFGHLHDFENWFPRIKELRPTYVLLYVGLNDMFYSQPHEDADRAFGDSGPLIQKLKGNSALYSLAQSIFNTYLVEKRNIGHGFIDYGTAKWTDKGLHKDVTFKLRSRLAEYETRFTLLLAEIEKMGARPIVVTQPRGDSRMIDGVLHGIQNALPLGQPSFEDSALGQLDNSTANGIDYYRILQSFNAISLQACQQRNGLCFDLADELKFGDADFYDYAHTTRSGAEKIANYLFERLSEEH